MRSIYAVYLTLVTALTCVAAHAQTDIAASIYGAFNGSTTKNNVQESPSNSAGVLLELRHISNPVLGFEATYAYNKQNEHYSWVGPVPLACPVGVPSCGPPPPVTVPSNAHEITADWVPSLKIGGIRPFGVLGIGALLNVPSGSNSTKTSTRAVYVYGAGLDWGILPHIGLRFQYRGNLYKAPDVTRLYTSVDKFTQTAEPVVGVYLRL